MFDKEKLKAAMVTHGDSNKDLAASLGMTASNFSTIWNGRQPFQRKHIIRIAVRYDLSPQKCGASSSRPMPRSLKKKPERHDLPGFCLCFRH